MIKMLTATKRRFRYKWLKKQDPDYSAVKQCLKVSKSRIFDFNNKVNVLGWSLQWILPILVLKRNDHLCSVYLSFFSPSVISTKLRSNSICWSLLLNCKKVKCEIILPDDSGIKKNCDCHHHLYLYSMMTVSIRID